MKEHSALACVVVPTYKSFEALSVVELLSIDNCFKILAEYPICFVGSSSLQWSGYRAYFTEKGYTTDIKELPDLYFSGISGYNKLMMSPFFYRLFGEFDYLLLHQTDCYVFRDELTAWCKSGYDYIGAPWLDTDIYSWLRDSGLYPKNLRLTHRLFKNKFLKQVGNGGFSLRKVSTFISVTERFWKAADNWKAFEDSFFSHYVGTFDPFFKIPNVQTALRFSFDAAPKKAFELNGHQLPFGCHAWHRTDAPHYQHNLDFWTSYIPVGKGRRLR